jgi:hypothetical protein
MTPLLWAAFGMTIGAAVLHGALGLTRPLDRTYLSFACIMALLAAYLYFEWELYHATTSEQAVEAMRREVIAAHGFLAGILVFVPAYTRARIPRWLMSAYWAGLALLFVANLVAPYGLWFSAEPELAPSTFRGEPYTVAVAPPMTALQYVHTLYVMSLFVLTFACALDVIRRGERQRGAMLALALVVAVAQHVADVVRDAVGGSWPYLAEFGLVAWGLIMSIQLAIDFRINHQRLHSTLTQAEQHAAELARMVEASLLVRDKLNTPLQTLELGLAMCTASGPKDNETLSDLRREVMELTQRGRAVELAANQTRRAIASQERAS